MSLDRLFDSAIVSETLGRRGPRGRGTATSARVAGRRRASTDDGLWLGGLVTLVVVLQPEAATDTRNNKAQASPEHAAYRFSSVATASIVTLIGVLAHTAPGEYVAQAVQLPYHGMWQLKVTVRSSDIDETTVATTIDIR